jgi:hypothetical protein
VSDDTAQSFLATDPCCRLRATRVLCLPESRLKRRDFLAASALLSLLAPSSVLAANKKKAATQDAAKPAAKSTAKPAGKTSSRDTARTSGSRASMRTRHSYRPAGTPTGRSLQLQHPAHHRPPQSNRATPSACPTSRSRNWRTYDITSLITLNQVKGKLRMWLAAGAVQGHFLATFAGSFLARQFRQCRHLP